MSSIDATVVLGLAGKTSRVFAEPGTYLSFPLSPIGFQRTRFEALARDPMSPEGQHALAEFSLLVNEVPDGPLWQPDGDQRLWDVYGDVLDEAELPDVARTPAEEADYQRAYGVLYTTDSEDAVVDPPAVVAYNQLRDAYLAAVHEHNNRKGQAELSEDPEVKDRWTRDEPVLLKQVTDAEQDWATAGHRAEVEEAQRVLQELSSRSPLLVWSGYRRLFDPDLPEVFFRTSPDGSVYLPTAYAPSDVIGIRWPTITVTREELRSLAGGAPEALRSRLASSTAGDDIDVVTFEYSAVTVQRPWCAPGVFASRAWRFHHPARVLSDGATPPTGECTAYVSGLVLARNIAVRRRTDRQRSAEATKPSLGFLPTARLATNPFVARPYPKALLAKRVAARRALSSPRAARALLGTQPAAPRVRDHRTRTTGPVKRASPGVRDHRTKPPVRVPVKRPPLLPPAAPPRPAPSGSSTTTTGPDEIYVLALVCRLLPKCPDPDPSLRWGATA